VFEHVARYVARVNHASYALTLALCAAGCAGDIGALAASAAGDVGVAADEPADPAKLDADAPPASARDVGRVPMHRLNNTEYDNTMRDLLGVSSTPGAAFIADEKLLGFDNIASALGMTDAQYEQYFNSADKLVEEAFADAGLRARLMICTPSSPADAACTKQIIEAFGLRAFRRPLQAAEVERLAALATDAIALGEDFTGGIKHVVKAMLSSASFLYRIELDPEPASGVAHALAGHELASRLSYLVWSTMPDDELFRLAGTGELLADAMLSGQLSRLLKDPRAAQFVSNFAGQWLGMRDLESHQVDTTAFPEWSEALRQAMVQEGLAYFAEFLTGDRAMTEFLTADVNFVDAPLAGLYGMSDRPALRARVTDATDQRRGFIGLASFLTLTSFSYRTAPTLRGKWVLENLLCQHVVPPPANVPQLDPVNADPSAAVQSGNIRQRLQAHRVNPECSGCHQALDPIGLGLENFDAIGRYRSKYDNGDDVDASGELPGGFMFRGLTELSTLLSADRRIIDCASEKLLTYALARELIASDQPFLQEIRDEWAASGMRLSTLLEQIVLSEPFRYRRGEAVSP
jgi:hypothetical protein